jgi:hypothetical protein
MSLSPLLTITEWHGIRAFAAAILALIGVLRWLAHGMHNLARSCRSLADRNNGPSVRARIRTVEDGSARQVLVLWFDDGRGRAGPMFFARRLLLLPITCHPSRSIPIPLARYRPELGVGRIRQHLEF